MSSSQPESDKPIDSEDQDFESSGGTHSSGGRTTLDLFGTGNAPALPSFAQEQNKYYQDRLQRGFRRKQHLIQLTKGEVSPIIVLSGASGAGKTHVMGLLNKSGIRSGQRLITRPSRVSDPPSDISWSATNPRHLLDNLLFSYVKYGNHYAFPKDTLIRSIRRDKSVALIAGDVGKLVPLNDALDYHIPFAPVVNIRIEVLLELVEKRLKELRKEASEGEAEARIRNNRILLNWERAQLAILRESLRVETWSNFLPSELEHAPAHTSPLDSNTVKELLEKAVKTEQQRSAYHASSCLIPIADLEDRQDFPAGLFEVLKEKLVPEIKAHHALALLKGGLAAQIYLSSAVSDTDAGRPELKGTLAFERVHPPKVTPRRAVSADIDWTFLAKREEKQVHQSIIESITGEDQEFATDPDKPVFRSEKINSSTFAEDAKTEVELDAIAVSRVKPKGSRFCFEFIVDDYLEFQRRDVLIEGEKASLALIPPEMLVIEKLCAGRGEELGKLDIYDAIATMISQPINSRSINHIVFSQKHDPDLDKKVTEKKLIEPSQDEVDERLEKMGFKNPIVRSTISNRMFGAQEEAESSAPEENLSVENPLGILPFAWNRDSLKQAALIDRLLTVLDKTASEELTALIENRKTRLSEIYSHEVISDTIRSMSRYLLHLVSYQIGRNDVYLERNFKPEWIG